MNGPLIGTHGAEAIPRQIGAFSDTHACMADQQKSVAAQIVTPQELLPEKLVVVCTERTRKSLRQTWDVLASNQMREIRELFVPGQFREDAALRDQEVDVRRCPERRSLCTEPGHPTEHVRIAVQLVECDYVSVISAEVG
jgi:hypothetical protein